MKKVILMLTALSMMAMLGACKSSDDDGGSSGINASLSDPKEAGKEVAKKYCECQKMKDKEKAYAKCRLEYEKMYNEYAAKFVEKKKDMEKYEMALEKASDGCVESIRYK